MKTEIMQRLNLILGALNSISVSGKSNLANLSGSIAMLEEVAQMLNGAEIVEIEKSTKK
jgi:hypothetical protein|nr:MAG TPA: hypothetical protein [Caudoviricetes sp.]